MILRLIRRFLSTVWCLASLLLVVPGVIAEDVRQPDRSLEPRDIIEIQLRALQCNDTPTTDAGIAQTWAFSHPDNRQITGPLERFAAMLKGPNYRILLDHRSYQIERVVRTPTMAIFRVRLVAVDGTQVSLKWQVTKVERGVFAGAWMTIGVSPPLRSRDAI